jgi:hypothetical protein
MVWWLVVIGFFVFIAFVIIILMVSTVKLEVLFLHEKNNDQLTIKGKIWGGLISYTFRIPSLKPNQESAKIDITSQTNIGTAQSKSKSEQTFSTDTLFSKIDQVKEMLEHVAGLHKIVTRFLKRVKVSNLYWDTYIGLGDAASTGVAAGMLWTVKGSLIGFLGAKMKVIQTPQLSVHPLFQMHYAQTKLSCIFSFKIGYAIGAAFQFVKFWKGRKQTAWENIQFKA